jgi:hypothetical protein
MNEIENCVRKEITADSFRMWDENVTVPLHERNLLFIL